MSDGIQGLIVYLCGAGIVGLVVWVWALWNSHNALKLKVAEEYLRHNQLDELKSEVRSLRDIVYKIAIKMEVPVFSEKY